MKYFSATITITLALAILFLPLTTLTSFSPAAPQLFAAEDTFQVSQVVTGETGSTPGGGGGGGGGGGSGPPQELILLSFIVIPNFTTALIQFETNIAVLPTIYWGLTPDYEIGTLTGASFLTKNEIKLENLKPGTKYYFKIKLLDQFEKEHWINDQYFTTLLFPSELLPENVLNLEATPDEKVITLTWENPKKEFDLIRLVRSDKFYPPDPFGGKVIYEGKAEKYIDVNVVKDVRYYYSAFTKDKFGNYSSGALADAMLLKPGERFISKDLFGGVLLLSKDLIHPQIKGLSLLDVDFIQDGIKLPVVNDTVDIRGDRNLKISIDYHKIPEILKTIAITLRDPIDPSKTFSFLLRVNKDKTAFEAIVGAFERPGKYTFGLSILDHKNQGLLKLAGVLVATMPELFGQKENNFFNMLPANPFFLLALFFLGLLVLIIAMVRRRRGRTFPALRFLPLPQNKK